MGKPKGFMELSRETVPYRDPLIRQKDFKDISTAPLPSQMEDQGARCMDCGVPFCQSEHGCPIDNLIPEWNHLVYRGDWYQALLRLEETNNFPEFTGKVCPAPCEGACVLGITDPPVTIKNIENAVVDRGFQEGWIQPKKPLIRTGKKIAIVGSGPAGLTAADELNKLGHSVTVFERADRIGGLLTYGIPNMKLQQDVIDRRVDLLRQAGVEFITHTNVGKKRIYSKDHLLSILKDGGVRVNSLPIEEVRSKYDALLLTTGATVPRDLPIQGRSFDGIHFAMDYLTRSTRDMLDGKALSLSAKGRRVIVIGGGDTGADCIGTALRQGCRSVVNFELLGEPPLDREPNNPWPKWPLIFRQEYSHIEAKASLGTDPRSYCVLSKEFIGNDQGRVKGIRTIRIDWNNPTDDAPFSEIAGSEEIWDCDMVLLSMGFIGPEHAISDDLQLEYDQRTNYRTHVESYESNQTGVFVAGDCRRGQSLVVWAINEGRGASRYIDGYVQGLN